MNVVLVNPASRVAAEEEKPMIVPEDKLVSFLDDVAQKKQCEVIVQAGKKIYASKVFNRRHSHGMGSHPVTWRIHSDTSFFDFGPKDISVVHYYPELQAVKVWIKTEYKDELGNKVMAPTGTLAEVDLASVNLTERIIINSLIAGGYSKERAIEVYFTIYVNNDPSRLSDYLHTAMQQAGWLAGDPVRGAVAENPSWVADHDIWTEAKHRAPNAPWGVVTELYKKMGGRIWRKEDWARHFQSLPAKKVSEYIERADAIGMMVSGGRVDAGVAEVVVDCEGAVGVERFVGEGGGRITVTPELENWIRAEYAKVSEDLAKLDALGDRPQQTVINQIVAKLANGEYVNTDGKNERVILNPSTIKKIYEGNYDRLRKSMTPEKELANREEVQEDRKLRSEKDISLTAEANQRWMVLYKMFHQGKGAYIKLQMLTDKSLTAEELRNALILAQEGKTKPLEFPEGMPLAEMRREIERAVEQPPLRRNYADMYRGGRMHTARKSKAESAATQEYRGDLVDDMYPDSGPGEF